MENLIQILVVLSTLLLWPVILLLLFFFGWALMEIGGTLREAWERRRGRKHWKSFVLQLQESSEVFPFLKDKISSYPHFTGYLGKFIYEGKNYLEKPWYLEKIFYDLELEMTARLSLLSLGVRFGPVLGLMGTLIPLGPALLGLSKGDIKTLASNLVIAFTTTILGLFIGIIFFGISHFRRSWYSQDLSDMEWILKLLEEHSP